MNTPLMGGVEPDNCADHGQCQNNLHSPDLALPQPKNKTAGFAMLPEPQKNFDANNMLAGLAAARSGQGGGVNPLAAMMLAQGGQNMNPLAMAALMGGGGAYGGAYGGGGYAQDAGPTVGRGRGRGAAAEGGNRDLLAKTLMAEAGGEGYLGMLAAGAVIANRVAAGNYGQGVDGVIMKPGQFSAWNSVTGYANGQGGLDMARITPSADAYAAADAILSGDYQDPTGGATHYYNPAAANPAWGERAGGNWQRIGNHIFGFADAGRG